MKALLKKPAIVLALLAALFLSFCGSAFVSAFAAEENVTEFTVTGVTAPSRYGMYIRGETTDGTAVTYDGQYLNAQDAADKTGALAAFFTNILVDDVPLSQDQPDVTYSINIYNQAVSQVEDCLAISSLDPANSFAPLNFADGTTLTLKAGLRLLTQKDGAWVLSEYQLKETQTFVYSDAAMTWTEQRTEEPAEYEDCAVSNVWVSSKNCIAVSFATLDGTEIENPVEGVNAQNYKTVEAFAPFFDNVLINGVPLSDPDPEGTVYAIHLFNPATGTPDHMAIFSFNSSNPTEALDFKDGTQLVLKEGLVLLAYDGESQEFKLSGYQLPETKTYTYDEGQLLWVDETAITEIKLDRSELNLETGKTDTLTATIVGGSLADQTVTWTSSDNEVATVENGTVTAVSVGTAIITATAADGKTVSCTVSVTAADAITSVMISQSTAKLEVGGTIKLTVTIKGNSQADTTTATWKSSDESVATVSADGTVTAVGEGTCIITVTSADATKKANCSVTVTKATAGEEPGDTEGGCSGATVGSAVTLSAGCLLAAAGVILLRRKKNVK